MDQSSSSSGMSATADAPSEDDFVKEGSHGKKMADDSIPTVSYFKLFSGVDGFGLALIVVGTIGALANGVLLPLFSIVFGEFTDALGNPGGPGFMSAVSNIALKFFYIGIAAVAASYLEVAAWMVAGGRQANRLRQRFLRAALAQDIAYYDTHPAAGGAVQCLNEDALDVQKAISEKMGNFIHHMCTFVVGFIISFVRGWDMTLVMLGCMPFLLLIGALLAKAAMYGNQASAAAYAEANTIAQQSITQVRTVAAYGREQAAIEQYDKALEKPRKTDLRLSWIGGVSFGSIMFVIYGSYAVGLFYGANRVAAGAYSGGHVLSVLVATIMSGFALGQAVPSLSAFAKGCTAGGRIFALFERTPTIGDGDSDGEHGKEVANKPDGGEVCTVITSSAVKPMEVGGAPVSINANKPQQQAMDTVRGELEFRDVVFAYPARPDVPVLRRLSLVVPAGSRVALVGPSGSGKSTVVALLERFYDPAEGSVLMDGRDIRTLPLRWLRGQMGLVNQEPLLFAASIYENITLGRPGTTPDEVEAAARAANAHEFVVALPQGYQTAVGPRGTQLSGGQKQRIAIARAILRNPKVLLLDEATSALDSRSEAAVQGALDALAVGRTTIVVAHRLSTIRGADRIVVMSAGCVAESGSHAELMGRPDGAYATLVRLQLDARGKDEDDEGVTVTWSPADSVDSCKPSGALMIVSSSQQQQQLLVHVHGGSGSKPAAPLPLLAEGASPPPPSSTAVTTVVHITTAAQSPSAATPSTTAIVVRATDGSDREGADMAASAKAAVADAPNNKTYKVPFRRLVPYIEGQGAAMSVGSFASVAAGAANPVFAFILASMIGIFYSLSPSELKSRASFYCWMFLVVAAGSGLSALAQQVAFGHVAQAVAGRIRAQLFRAILRQEVGWFDEPDHSPGRMTAVLSTDAAAVRGAVVDICGLAITNLSTLACGYVIAFVHDWRMTLLVTGLLPFAAAGNYLQYRYQSGQGSESDKAYGNANQAVTEAFSAIRVVHAYGLQYYVEHSYDKMLLAANRAVTHASNVAGVAYAFSNMTMFAMYSVVVYFMGSEVAHGWADFSSALVAFLALVMAAMGMAQAAMSFPSIGPARQALRNVFPILDRSPAIDSCSEQGAQQPEAAQQARPCEIAFRDVVFAYPARPDVPVLRRLSLVVPAGSRVALVGPSGSGKSTVVALLERFYDPAEGSVLMDGIDLRALNLRHLRRQIGLVSQEPLLFDGTIAENILVGKPDASRDEVLAAAESANARGFIEALPDGYETPVGEGGAKLSGGQKQRIAIARALVRQPRLLLLDEATSALDAACEAAVQAALEVTMAGRTSLVVAHRLSTIRGADRIVVMSAGCVAESGSHAELMGRPGSVYAALVAAQQSEGRG